MKLKYDFVITEIGDEFAAVAVDEGAESFHGMIRLNKEAKIIFEMLNGNDVSFYDIVNKIKLEYTDSAEDEIKKKVTAFTENLKSENLIIE